LRGSYNQSIIFNYLINSNGFQELKIHFNTSTDARIMHSGHGHDVKLFEVYSYQNKLALTSKAEISPSNPKLIEKI